ncbi:hypothetical protein HRH25_23295 [Flavisolibacter sp. BT320]|nr:hypothetical protein [Flavisolibacter longurius]
MGKKVFWMVLIPALLIIGGYLLLQIYLRRGNGKTDSDQIATTGNRAANLGEDSTKTDSLGGKKVSALDLRPLFIQKLQSLVNKTTNGLYQLAVGDMDLDVLASEVSLRNVTLKPDAGVLKQLQSAGELPPNVFTISFAALGIEGINLDDAVTSKTMDYKIVKLVNPVIRIDRYTGSKQKDGDEFSQQFLKEMEKLAIGRIIVENGQVVVHDKKKGSTKTFKNVGVEMKNILLNSSTRTDKNRFLFAKEATMEFHDFSTTLNKGLYRFSVKDALINATGKQVVLKNLRLGSPLSKQAFMKKQSHATELYNLTIPTTTINGVDWWTMLNGDAIDARTVQTRGGRFSVYFDRSLPLKNKMGNFPNQLLAKLQVALSVTKVQMRDLDIAYEEFNPISGQSGTVSLSNTNLTVSNLHNNPNQGQPVVVSGTSSLMGSIPLRASFRFPLQQAKKGMFSATLQTGAFQGKVLNPITRPLGMLNIDEGSVKKLEVTMQGHEWGAKGMVALQYNDLKLSMLEKNKEGKGMNDKNLLSFLANALVIRNSNPAKEGEAVQKKEASFDRDPNSGFMNLVWKTAFTGILRTIGAPEKMANSKPVQ